MSSQSSFDLWIFRSLRRIMRAVDIHSRKLSAEFMVTTPQLLCLQTLHEDGPLTTSALAKLVHLSNSTVVGILDRLEQKEWVTRERGVGDRRVVLVDLTALGEGFLSQAPGLLQDRLASGIHGLPEDEQLAIAQALEKIVELLEMKQEETAPLLESGPISEGVEDSPSIPIAQAKKGSTL